MDDTPCQVNPDLWYSIERKDQIVAQGICIDICPFVTECGIHALEENEQFGIWGGMTENERRMLKRRGRKKATLLLLHKTLETGDDDGEADARRRSELPDMSRRDGAA